MAVRWHKCTYAVTQEGKNGLKARADRPDSLVESTHVNRILRALLTGNKSVRDLVPFISTKSSNPEQVVKCMIGFMRRDGLVRSVAVEPVVDEVTR